ncbi:MAG TPA: hypothetical protein VLI69_03905 [Gammaproteobacteria bacterium]|nr:hypothetical protein [Gammaproteobacteria bacterium]
MMNTPEILIGIIIAWTFYIYLKNICISIEKISDSNNQIATLLEELNNNVDSIERKLCEISQTNSHIPSADYCEE